MFYNAILAVPGYFWHVRNEKLKRHKSKGMGLVLILYGYSTGHYKSMGGRFLTTVGGFNGPQGY